jgi:hypothetical protein
MSKIEHRVSGALWGSWHPVGPHVPLCHRPTPSSARCPASGCRGWTSVCPMAASRHELASLMDGLGFCVVRLRVSPEGWTMTSRPGTLRRCLGSSMRMLARDQFPAGGVMAGGQGGRLGLSVPETDGSAGARSTPAASRPLESSPKGGMEARRSSKVSQAQQVSPPSNST